MLAFNALIQRMKCVDQALGFDAPNLKRLGRGTLFIAIVGYLFFQLSRIGFAEIVQALPTSPLFYALSIGFVAAPVLAEIVAFKTITGRKVGKDYKLFLRKHILNKAVMNFSGEVFFVQKLSKYEGLNLLKSGIILKDMTLIRLFSANLWIMILTVMAVLFGNWDILENIATSSPVLVILVTLLCISVCTIAVVWFRKLTRLSSKTVLKVTAIYLIRAIIVGVILMTQWSLASPGTAIGGWFIFLIVFLVAKKSPVGGEILFASIVVSLPSLGGGDAAIAAMLIAIAGITQIIYFLGFLLSLEGKNMQQCKQPRLAIA